MMLAGILSVAGDLAAAWLGMEVSCSVFLAAFFGMGVIFFLLNRSKPKRVLKTAVVIMACLPLLAAGLFAGWKVFSDGAVFSGADAGKQQLYGDKKVMLIVPHQDDEINVLGGVMEEYVRYGSDVYVIFSTNGDAYGLAETRFREALDVCGHIGIPEENVIFLGYGDTLPGDGVHLYNATGGKLATSSYGAKATYGTQAKGVWREGAKYTAENLLADLENVILTVRPELIFCSDYDNHIDHRALSLAFEKVMGRILNEDGSYRPVVMKGYAYGTAWYAPADFYEMNLLSTQDVFAVYGQRPAVYRWSDRARLPVGDYTLSRSLFSSETFHTLSLHASQEAIFQASGIINGDKVFWHRSTESLLYDAEVSVGSGNGKLLTDFMLLESGDLMNMNHLPYDSVWIPQGGENTITVTFSENENVRQIRLYDHPSEEDNVLDAQIVFSDGTVIMTGPLDPAGAATVIAADVKDVSGFAVTLTKTEGSNAGLTELEAYRTVPDNGMRYLKITDTAGNFLYDYWMPSGSNGWLDLYTSGLTPERLENLKLDWDSDKCWAGLENGSLRVIVPEGKSMLLTVSVADTDISDTVKISNPGKLTRLFNSLGQLLEEQIFQKYCEGAHRRSATYKLAMTALDMVRNSL